MSTYVITANNIAELGGAQHVAHTLARGLVSRGHSVYLVGITPVADPHPYSGRGLHHADIDAGNLAGENQHQW